MSWKSKSQKKQKTSKSFRWQKAKSRAQNIAAVKEQLEDEDENVNNLEFFHYDHEDGRPKELVNSSAEMQRPSEQ